MNLQACSLLPAMPVQGTWYRATHPRFASVALSAAHTPAVRSRFSPGRLRPPAEQFQMLYLADDPIVASFEFGALLGSPYTPARQLPNPGLPCVIVPVLVRLARVIDLTDAIAQDTIDVSAQE